MKEIFLGEVIRQRRLELGLTQEELCEGICEPMTISRFENGKQTPARNRIRALLQRLGLPDDRFFGLLSTNETRLGDLEKELVSCHVRFERATPADQPAIRQEALALHAQMEALADKDDVLTRQEILRSQFLLGSDNGPYSYEEGMAILLSAMHLTSPRFTLDNIGSGLYMDNEVKLINNMANCSMRTGHQEDAIRILHDLLTYLQTHTQKIPPHKAHIPLVAFNYIRDLSVAGRYDEALTVGEYVRQLCIDYGYYLTLPPILHVLAGCHYHLGRPEESMELYRQAYYLYKVIEDDNDRIILQQEVKDFFGIELN